MFRSFHLMIAVALWKLSILAVIAGRHLAIHAMWTHLFSIGNGLQLLTIFPDAEALECTGLSKCKQWFAEQLVISTSCRHQSRNCTGAARGLTNKADVDNGSLCMTCHITVYGTYIMLHIRCVILRQFNSRLYILDAWQLFYCAMLHHSVVMPHQVVSPSIWWSHTCL